jgi:hypothetical protein
VRGEVLGGAGLPRDRGRVESLQRRLVQGVLRHPDGDVPRLRRKRLQDRVAAVVREVAAAQRHGRLVVEGARQGDAGGARRLDGGTQEVAVLWVHPLGSVCGAQHRGSRAAARLQPPRGREARGRGHVRAGAAAVRLHGAREAVVGGPVEDEAVALPAPARGGAGLHGEGAADAGGRGVEDGHGAVGAPLADLGVGAEGVAIGLDLRHVAPLGASVPVQKR